MHPVRQTIPDSLTPVLHDAGTVPSTSAPVPPAGPPLRLASPPAPRRPAEAAPLPPARRPHPWLLVVVDDDPSSYAGLVWALREAARREATVVAVSVDDGRGDPLLGVDSPRSRHAELDVRVQEATAETGVCVEVRTAVLDAAVLAALSGAASGADLVVVGPSGKRLLRPAVPRSSVRGVARGA
jgi:universal stress protein family protein